MRMNPATALLRAPWLALWVAVAAFPARALDLESDKVRAFSEEMKKKHGFEPAWLDGVLADAALQPRIIELMTKPAIRVTNEVPP